MLWVQAPLATFFCLGVFFSIPTTFTTGGEEEDGSIREKLAKIDYLGAVVLVRIILSRDFENSLTMIYLGYLTCTVPLWVVISPNPVYSGCYFSYHIYWICVHRILRSSRPNYPHHGFEVTRGSSLLYCTARSNDLAMDRSVLRARLCSLGPRMESCDGWDGSYSHQPRICRWRSSCWWFTRQAHWQFLAVPSSPPFKLNNELI